MDSITFEISPLIRQILQAELAQGNRIAEVHEGWPTPTSTIILLSQPFQEKYSIQGLTHIEINDPHYWKEEYQDVTFQQTIACKFQTNTIMCFTSPFEHLNSYLQNPLSPTWSSQGIKDLLEELDGSMKEKQLLILPLIDERFSESIHKMTDPQYHFLKEITLHTKYSKTQTKFSVEDLKWLIDKFKERPTQQRAVLILMLLGHELIEINPSLFQEIKQVLAGTIAECL